MPVYHRKRVDVVSGEYHGEDALDQTINQPSLNITMLTSPGTWLQVTCTQRCNYCQSVSNHPVRFGPTRSRPFQGPGWLIKHRSGNTILKVVDKCHALKRICPCQLSAVLLLLLGVAGWAASHLWRSKARHDHAVACFQRHNTYKHARWRWTDGQARSHSSGSCWRSPSVSSGLRQGGHCWPGN